MKIKIIMLALLCSACTEKPLSTQETQNLLSQYTWAYTPPNSDTPIKLTFNLQTISMDSECNVIGTGYYLKNNLMGVRYAIPSTVMGCPPHLEKQESFITGFFEQPVPFKISSRSTQHPKLIFQKDQQEYIFIGTKLSQKNKNPNGE
mgnify:FL=1